MTQADRLMIAKMFSLIMSVLLTMAQRTLSIEKFERAERQYFDFVDLQLKEWTDSQ